MKHLTENQIRAALARAREGLEKYIRIMKRFPTVDVSKDKAFQTLYDDLYKVRRNKEFRDAYFAFMEKHRKNPPSFVETVNYLYEFGKLEASFASKLLATIDPNLPVWDKYVLKNFDVGTPGRWLAKEERIRLTDTRYSFIQLCYSEFISSEEGRKWISLFDEQYPNSPVTAIKKIDLILWQARDDGEA